MKIKKLLSLGAIGLTVACFASIGASAAELPSDISSDSKAKILFTILINQYENGKNQTDLFNGINKDTKVESVVSSDLIDKINADFGTSLTVDKAVSKYDNNKELTFAQALDKLTANEAGFNKFKADFKTVADKVVAMDNITDPDDRAKKETDVINLVNAYNSSLKVEFGKNGAGETCANIKENGKLLVGLSVTDAKKIIDKLNGITFNQVQEVKKLL